MKQGTSCMGLSVNFEILGVILPEHVLFHLCVISDRFVKLINSASPGSNLPVKRWVDRFLAKTLQRNPSRFHTQVVISQKAGVGT